MNDKPPLSIAELIKDRSLINEALNRGVREAVLRHARDGHPISAWRDGKVVWIPPQEVLAEFGDASNGMKSSRSPEARG